MKDGEMILIAQLLLESRTGAYIEWIDNKLILTANKLYLKDKPLILLSAKQKNQQALLPICKCIHPRCGFWIINDNQIRD
jgi:hypothetical protein